MKAVRVIVGLLVGVCIGMLMMFAGGFAAAVLGVPESASGVLDSLALFAGFALGMWLMFHLWKVESKPPKPSVPPDEWGKRP
jgi:hypothetical protein